MRKLFNFMKPYAGSVFAILCVLMIQAYCELSLPTYTSNIVNIGIQQSGIDENVPKTILEEDLKKLLVFIPLDEQKTVQEAYEEGKYDAYHYTGDREGVILRLKEDILNDKKKLKELSDILTKPMMLVSGFNSESDMAKQMKEQMTQMPEEQWEQAIQEITKKLDDMPDSILEQAGTAYVRQRH